MHPEMQAGFPRYPPRAHTGLRQPLAFLVFLSLGCDGDFPNEPASALTLQPVGWPTELAVTDVVTLEVDVRLRDTEDRVSGLQMRWESSDENVLGVEEVQPTPGADTEDSLLAQRRAVVTGRSGGTAEIRVIVDSGGPFEPAESTYALQVTEKWISISAGKAHTCGITINRLAYCWGEGDEGRLGDGRPLPSAVPVPVLALGDLQFVAVDAGDESTCGIIAEGVTYCWGLGESGRLGDDDIAERSQLAPTPVSGPLFGTVEVGPAVCGVARDDRALCWGGNEEGHLGFNPLQSPGLDTCLDGNPCSLVPLQVSFSGDAPDSYLSVTVGDDHACGVSHVPEDSLAFCWGTGVEGALGTGTSNDSPTPSPVVGGHRFRALSAGGSHTCGIAGSQTLCWGTNSDGQLGNGGTDLSLIPVPVSSGSFVALSSGGAHTCALTGEGEAFCWGLGSSGQLGNGSTVSQTMPIPVSEVLRFEALSAGEFHTCGIARGGAAYCWGRGSAGRLGNGDTEDKATPTRVSEPAN